MAIDGLCECGCGQATTIAPQTNSKRGWVRGQPVRFIHNHQTKGKWGPAVHAEGYVQRMVPGHPRATKKGYVPEQVLVVEKILGKFLPLTAIVHHDNGVRDDNRPENLVVCQDLSHHRLIHARQTAYEACGHANWRKCKICHQYDDPTNMTILNSRGAYHKKCNTEHYREYREKRRNLNAG